MWLVPAEVGQEKRGLREQQWSLMAVQKLGQYMSEMRFELFLNAFP